MLKKIHSGKATELWMLQTKDIATANNHGKQQVAMKDRHHEKKIKAPMMKTHITKAAQRIETRKSRLLRAEVRRIMDVANKRCSKQDVRTRQRITASVGAGDEPQDEAPGQEQADSHEEAQPAPLVDADPDDAPPARDERDDWLEALRSHAAMRLDPESRIVFDTAVNPECDVGSIRLVSQWGSRKDPSFAVHCKLHGCRRIVAMSSAPNNGQLLEWFREGRDLPPGVHGRQAHLALWPSTAA